MRSELQAQFDEVEALTGAQRGLAFEQIVAALFRAHHFDVRWNPRAARPRQTDLVATKVAFRRLGYLVVGMAVLLVLLAVVATPFVLLLMTPAGEMVQDWSPTGVEHLVEAGVTALVWPSSPPSPAPGRLSCSTRSPGCQPGCR